MEGKIIGLYFYIKELHDELMKKLLHVLKETQVNFLYFFFFFYLYILFLGYKMYI